MKFATQHLPPISFYISAIITETPGVVTSNGAHSECDCVKLVHRGSQSGRDAVFFAKVERGAAVPVRAEPRVGFDRVVFKAQDLEDGAYLASSHVSACALVLILGGRVRHMVSLTLSGSAISGKRWVCVTRWKDKEDGGVLRVDETHPLLQGESVRSFALASVFDR